MMMERNYTLQEAKKMHLDCANRSVDGCMHTSHTKLFCILAAAGLCKLLDWKPVRGLRDFDMRPGLRYFTVHMIRTIVPKKSAASPPPAKGKGKRALAITQTPKVKAKPEAEQAKPPKKAKKN